VYSFNFLSLYYNHIFYFVAEGLKSGQTLMYVTLDVHTWLETSVVEWS